MVYGTSGRLLSTGSRSAQAFSQNASDVQGDVEDFDDFSRVLGSGDFNGDGYADLAIGVPGEDLDREGVLQRDAGLVHVIYGSASGVSPSREQADQAWSQGSGEIEGDNEQMDLFGSALATGDFNQDGFADLAIGVPGEDLSNGQLRRNAGAVNVIYGSSSGLSATQTRSDQIWSQNAQDIGGDIETGDSFGACLESGDFNGDGYVDLAIGVPGEDLSRDGVLQRDAGLVQVIYGSATGLSATNTRSSQDWSQNATDIGGDTETSDRFGTTLSSGDFNGDGLVDLAIGVPGEDLSRDGVLRRDAGLVQVIYGLSLIHI